MFALRGTGYDVLREPLVAHQAEKWGKKDGMSTTILQNRPRIVSSIPHYPDIALTVMFTVAGKLLLYTSILMG